MGATGFIGARLVRAFAAAGHEVSCASRSAQGLPEGCTRHVPLDYTALPNVEDLRRAVMGHDVVINAVGILRERGRQTFAALHDGGPRALFAACVAAGVPRVIQISALGAAPGAIARYHQSKHAADRYLMDQPVDWVVIQPSLVYGPGGGSARMFNLLASLPVIPLPAGGHQRVQPLHVDDLIGALLQLAGAPAPLRFVVPVAGPEPLSMREFLTGLRTALGRPKTLTLAVPGFLMRVAARIGDFLPGAMLDSETWAMLERGNVG